MIIVYGSTLLGKTDRIGLIENCQLCGQRGRLESFTARKWATLYWIPIFPCGSTERVLRLCPACKQYRSIALSALPQAIEQTEQEARAALAQQRPGDAAGGAIFLGDLGQIDSGLAIAAALEQAGCIDEATLAAATLYEMAGDLAAAADILRRSAERRPKAAAPRQQYAQFFIDYGQPIKAHPLLTEAVRLEPDNASARLQLAYVQEGLGLWSELYENLIRLATLEPELVRDKQFARLQKAAAKHNRLAPATSEKRNPYAS